MKPGNWIFIKTAVLVLTFVLLLGVGILSLTFLHQGTRQNEDEFLTPEHAVAAPTAQELLRKKFDAYNTVTEEDGKSVVTIFSEGQIADIRTRRENGEWFWLSGEEMLYLVNDTVKLFEEYDVVRICSLSGQLTEYFCEVGFASQDTRTLVLKAALQRIMNLNSACFDYLGTTVLFADAREQLEFRSYYQTLVSYFDAFPKSDELSVSDALSSLPSCGALITSDQTRWLNGQLLFSANVSQMTLKNLVPVI